MSDDDTPRRGLSSRAIIYPLLALAVAAFVFFVQPHTPNPHAGERFAIGMLKTIDTAQTLFREDDRDGDGKLDYGNLQELSNATLIDGILGSGTKQGYVFQVRPSPTTGDFLWFAVANPVPSEAGKQSFCTNHAGVIHYTGGAIALEAGGAECTIPAGLRRIGE
jgi:hypothetical protein